MAARRTKWSASATKRSNALDLEPGVFTWRNPEKIARSLRRSAEQSERRRGSAYQSAMSMLNFYVNRAGVNLPERQKRVLARAKEKLRALYGR